MNVRELIQWLAMQDQEATVQILVTNNINCYEYYRDDFDPSKHSDYTDFRDYQFKPGDPRTNVRTLFLGSDD